MPFMSPLNIFIKSSIIGASLSEPHASLTGLQDACTCPVRMYVRPYLNLTNGYDFAHVLKLLRLEREARKGLLLDCSAKETRADRGKAG